MMQQNSGLLNEKGEPLKDMSILRNTL